MKAAHALRQHADDGLDNMHAELYRGTDYLGSIFGCCEVDHGNACRAYIAEDVSLEGPCQVKQDLWRHIVISALQPHCPSPQLMNSDRTCL